MQIPYISKLGNLSSIYGFYDGNFLYFEKFQLTSRIAVGLNYSPKIYNPNDPMPVDVFSTHMNIFAELGAGIAVRVRKRVFVESGFRFLHISNGNIREPQRGFNDLALNLSIRSSLNHMAPKPLKKSLDECLHRHEIIGFLGFSTRQIDFRKTTLDNHPETYEMNYIMTNLLVGYQFEATRRLKIGGGIDLFYDGTLGQVEAAIKGKPSHNAVPFKHKTGLSIFIGGELAINRLSIVGGLSQIILRQPFESSSPSFEQRAGLRYFINENTFLGMNVRAYNFRSAKAMELNIGKRFGL